MNAIAWFEIPARDIDRAQRFYETLLAAPLRREQIGPNTLAVLPYQPGSGVGGCVMASPALQPAAQGTLVYLPVRPTLAVALERLAEAGGRALGPIVTLPGEMGAFVHVEDCEGNRVGLHASA